MDPVAVIAALATTVSALGGILYRTLLQRAERAEADAAFWRERYLLQVGKTDLALDEAERRGK